MKANSLATRATAFAIVQGLLLFAVVGVALAWAQKRSVEQAFANHLAAYADLLIPAVSVERGELVLDDSALIRRIPRHWQISKDGEPLFRSASLSEWLPVLEPSTGSARLHVLEYPGGSMHAVQTRYLYPRDTPVDVIFGLDAIVADTYKAALRAELRGTLFAILAAAAICLAAFAVIGVRWFIAPVRAIQSTVARIKSGRDERIEDRFPSEIQALADEINLLIDQNNDVIDRYRTFSGNLAHSLRTPLSTIGAENDLAAIRGKVETMRQIIDRNLARANAVGPDTKGRRATLVKPVLQKICGAYGRLYDKQASLELPDDLMFRGDGSDLYEMAGNVIENAFQNASTKVTVNAAVGRIAVDDDGPGIAPAHHAQVLERGIRLDRTRAGVGIGLAVARDLVALYAGELTLGRSCLGGLEVVLELPIDHSTEKDDGRSA
ncbi:MAG: ATP-binding protein [Gammaproteobacteria bacterium]